jgi:hypothetical protein
MNMFDRETIEAVKAVNAGLGTKHRTKPYDLNNAEDMKQALELAVAAYRDYWHYAQVLGGLGDDFDESLENYDTAAWLGLKPEQTDLLSDNCADAIETAWRLFDELKNRAREHFAQMLKAVLTSDHISRKVFGKAYKIEPGEIDGHIEGVIDSLDESEYFHPIPENYKLLLQRADELWGDND